MRCTKRMLSVIGLVVVAGGVGAALAQSESPLPAREEIAAMFAQVGAPVVEHERLGVLEGDWDVESKFYYFAEPLVIAGTAHGEWILGGRFLRLSTSPAPDEAIALESMTLHGFDTRTSEYFIVGVDTMGTYCVSAFGGYDAPSRTITLQGENAEGGMTMAFQWNLRAVDDDHLVQSIRFKDPASPDGWKTIVDTTFTRRD